MGDQSQSSDHVLDLRRSDRNKPFVIRISEHRQQHRRQCSRLRHPQLGSSLQRLTVADVDHQLQLQPGQEHVRRNRICRRKSDRDSQSDRSDSRQLHRRRSRFLRANGKHELEVGHQHDEDLEPLGTTHGRRRLHVPTIALLRQPRTKRTSLRDSGYERNWHTRG